MIKKTSLVLLPIVTILLLIGLLSIQRPLFAYDGCGNDTPLAVDAAFEQELMALINAYRVENISSSLLIEPQLVTAARYLAADMVADDYFNGIIHDRVDGQLVEVCSFWDMAANFSASPISLLYGQGYSSAQSAFNSWLDGGYLAQATEPTTTQIGVGYAVSASGSGHVVLTFGRGTSGQPLATPDPNVPTITPTPSPTPRPTRLPGAAINCNPTNGSGGQQPGTYDITIAGNPVTLIVGDGYDPSRPTYLSFYLHGDEGGYDYAQSSFSPINQFVTDNGWIYVAPQADAVSDSYYPWHSDGIGVDNNVGVEANTQLIIDTFSYVYNNFNVCRDLLFGGSASGGSWYFDTYFYAEHGATYPAFMNLGCGSGGMSTNSYWSNTGYYDDVAALADNPDIMARTEFNYTIGTADFLFPNAQTSANTYMALGYSVLTDYRDGISHCDFDVAKSTADYWGATIDSLNIAGQDGSIPTAVQTNEIKTDRATPLLLIATVTSLLIWGVMFARQVDTDSELMASAETWI